MLGTSQRTKTPLDANQLSSLNDGLDAIENRSNGLMNFTEAYRSLTRIPLPNITSVDGRLYFQRINSLFIPTHGSTFIAFEMQLPKADFNLDMDPDLMEQVLINLLKNTKEAIIENGVKDGKITLKVQQSSNTVITISDNGGGIPADVMDNIFIPFFTTKNTGSGIGLSLVKQIVQLHKGDIEVLTSDEINGITIKISL
jgi:nitrogen fixation/metabolism regulation signal transduction histidine kinase